jgi:putative transposase
MFVAENFFRNLVNKYGKRPVNRYDSGTWYSYACKFLKLRHHFHSSFEKSIIERSIQYFKDRKECFDDYYPCRHTHMSRCEISHLYKWARLFMFMRNTASRHIKFTTMIRAMRR